MSNKVFEEAPQAPQPSAGGALDKIRKAARQLAYDTRYKVKQKFGDNQKTDPASLKRAYMQQLGASSAPGPVKALAKKMLIGEEYDFVEIKEISTSNILTKIFVEGGGKKAEIEKVQEAADTRYVIRVTDKKTGKSYLRKATDAKIAELRKNPNIRSVEKTGRTDQSDTYDRTGQKTAKVKAGKGLDPVGKEDNDPDNDGVPISKDKNDQYIMKRRAAIGKQIAKEEVIYEKQEKREEKLDVMKGKNNVIINPSIDEKMDLAKADMGDVIKDFQKSDAPQFKGKTKKERQKMAIAAKLTAERGGKELEEQSSQVLSTQKNAVRKQKQALDAEIKSLIAQKRSMREEAKVCEKCGKSPCECDNVDEREMPTKATLFKNKLRAKGIKVAGLAIAPRNMKTADELEGESMDEATRYAKETGKSFRTGKKRVEGGSMKNDPAFQHVSKMIRGMQGRPEGQRPQVKGKKPPAAGEYGGPKSPAQKVAARRARKAESERMMSSRFD